MSAKWWNEEDQENLRDPNEDLPVDETLVESNDDEEDEPSAETDYMEVTEYVRVVASSLYFEFAVAPDEAPDPSTTAPVSHQLH